MQNLSLSRNPNLSYVKSQDQNTKPDLQISHDFQNNWWTGLAPDKCPGFDKERNCLVSLPLLNLDICTRQDVLDYFNNSWTLTELLFSGLVSEKAFFNAAYHQLRHPLIFYYGHPAVLYINKLRLAGLLENPVDVYLEKILETGVDEMSWDDMSKNEMLWPKVSEVKSYRQKVYNLISNLILTHPDLMTAGSKKADSKWWALWMGIEHEKIHFETSSVLMRELPHEWVLVPKYFPPISKFSTDKVIKEIKWLNFKESSISWGKEKIQNSYGWDNEYGRRCVNLKEFTVSETQITNLQFYDFVKSGAYIDDQYWEAEGLQWRKFRNVKRPTFWMASGPEGLHEYKLRTIFDVIDMPWDWPVEINYHEAKAYINWFNKRENKNLRFRLLTEAEYQYLISLEKNETVLQSKSYKETKIEKPDYNFNFFNSSPEPVNHKLRGNVWHWLEDQFNPLEGFEVHKFYDDFSTPCFDGKHQMILGGSFISCGHESSRYARFHFRPHFFQHAGFRIAATLDGSADNGAFKFKKDNNYIHQQRKNFLAQMQNESWWRNLDQPLDLKPDQQNTELQTAINFLSDYRIKFKDQNPAGKEHVSLKQAEPKIPYQASADFPMDSSSLKEILKVIFNDLQVFSQLPGHPQYAGYLAGSGNVYSSIADLIASDLNPFSGHYSFAPGLVQLEAEVIKWFLNLFKYSQKESLGFFTSGGSLAILSAISLARYHSGFDYSKLRLYASDQSHHCVPKAMKILGFEDSSYVTIPTNENLEISINDLEIQIQKDIAQGLKPFMIVGTVGTTTSGSVDDLKKIAEVSKRYNLWFHVDGAYGAGFYITEIGKKMLEGIELSDSMSFDPHKSFSIPYGTGLLLVKDKDKLVYKYSGDKKYMPPENIFDDTGLKIDFSEISPELSKPLRGLRLWLPLKVLGLQPFILNLEEKLKLAQFAQDELSKDNRFVICTKARLSLFTFYVNNTSTEISNEKTKKLLEKINSSGKSFFSPSWIKNQFVIRWNLLSHQTHYNDVNKMLLELKELVSYVY